MDKNEYENKKREYESMTDKSGKEIPEDVQKMIKDSENHPIPDEEKNNDIYSDDDGVDDSEPKSLSQLNQESVEDLPDLTEFMETEEYLRLGTDMRIPIQIEIQGQKFKVYIRPLNANEFYNLQLKQMREKKSLDYLACVAACTDSEGKPIPRKLLDKLGFNIVSNIGGAIRIASGETQEEDITQDLLRNLLEE